MQDVGSGARPADFLGTAHTHDELYLDTSVSQLCRWLRSVGAADSVNDKLLTNACPGRHELCYWMVLAGALSTGEGGSVDKGLMSRAFENYPEERDAIFQLARKDRENDFVDLAAFCGVPSGSEQHHAAVRVVREFLSICER